MKILVVDDSKAMRMIVIRTLKQCDFGEHTIVEATNGEEALKLIEEERFGVVLSDWNMPEMKGIDLLKKLREAGDTTRLGFITSESSPEVRDLALGEGAEFILTKPFTVDAMERELSPIFA